MQTVPDAACRPKMLRGSFSKREINNTGRAYGICNLDPPRYWNNRLRRLWSDDAAKGRKSGKTRRDSLSKTQFPTTSTPFTLFSLDESLYSAIQRRLSLKIDGLRDGNWGSPTTFRPSLTSSSSPTSQSSSPPLRRISPLCCIDPCTEPLVPV